MIISFPLPFCRSTRSVKWTSLSKYTIPFIHAFFLASTQYYVPIHVYNYSPSLTLSSPSSPFLTMCPFYFLLLHKQGHGTIVLRYQRLSLHYNATYSFSTSSIIRSDHSFPLTFLFFFLYIFSFCLFRSFLTTMQSIHEPPYPRYNTTLLPTSNNYPPSKPGYPRFLFLIISHILP